MKRKAGLTFAHLRPNVSHGRIDLGVAEPGQSQLLALRAEGDQIVVGVPVRPLWVDGLAAQLVGLNGSSYYLIAGFLLIASGVFLFRRMWLGVGIYALVVCGTIAWSCG